MSWTRRGLLGAAATAAALGAIGTGSGQASAATPPALRRSIFEPLLGRTVTLTQGRRQARVRLIGIRDVLGAPHGSEASFMLRFASSRPLSDDIYTLHHRRAGSHDVFVSGVGTGRDRRYEVLVNRTGPAWADLGAALVW